MAKLTVQLDIKQTEAFTVLLQMSNDIRELIDMAPDCDPQKVVLTERLEGHWKRMVGLVEQTK